MTKISELSFYNHFIENLLGISDKQVIQHILNTVTIEHHEINRYIFKEGDEIDKKYYVVLKGMLIRKKSHRNSSAFIVNSNIMNGIRPSINIKEVI